MTFKISMTPKEASALGCILKGDIQIESRTKLSTQDEKVKLVVAAIAFYHSLSTAYKEYNYRVNVRQYNNDHEIKGLQRMKQWIVKAKSDLAAAEQKTGLKVVSDPFVSSTFPR